MRLLEWAGSIGPFKGHCNHLEKAGDATTLHCHRNDHLLIAGHGDFDVFAILPSGQEITVTVEDTGFGFGQAEAKLIKAHIQHKIVARSDNVRFCCLFSHFDEHGRYTPNPDEGDEEAEALYPRLDGANG